MAGECNKKKKRKTNIGNSTRCARSFSDQNKYGIDMMLHVLNHQIEIFCGFD